MCKQHARVFVPNELCRGWFSRVFADRSCQYGKITFKGPLVCHFVKGIHPDRDWLIPVWLPQVLVEDVGNEVSDGGGA